MAIRNRILILCSMMLGCLALTAVAADVDSHAEAKKAALEAAERVEPQKPGAVTMDCPDCPHPTMNIPLVAPPYLPACEVYGIPFADSAVTPLADNGTTVVTVDVSIPAAWLWDVDLTMNLTHTWNADLDITLTSPAGTTVLITSDNAGGNDDVFDGTVWDDQGGIPVTDYVFTNGVAAPTLVPEGALSIFNGEDPNGIWTLTVTDDANGDAGTLSGWSLWITAFLGTPSEATTPHINANPVALHDLTATTSTITVSGQTLPLSDVNLFTGIYHTANADLDITLTSPAGTVVTVTTDNGGLNDDVFLGTIWDDSAPDTVDDYVFANLITAAFLVPEGAFAAFHGEDPNGDWILTIYDDTGGDEGTLLTWFLDLTTAECTADLAITKTADQDPVPAGLPLTYTLSVVNNGLGQASNTVVTDTLPAGAVYQSCSTTQGTCSEAGGVVTWDVGFLPAYDSETATITVILPVGGLHTNTATVVSDAADPDLTNNTAAVDVTAEDADLAVTKTSDQDPVPAGLPLTYTVAVTNNGPGPALNAVLTDTLPAGAVYQSCTTTHGTCAEAGGVVTAALGDLASGETATVTIVVVLPTGGVYTNTADAASDVNDPNLADNSAALDVTAEDADLAVTKTADQDPVPAGLPLTYTVTVTNNGPGPAVNTVLTDTLPAGALYQSCATTHGTCAEAGGVVTAALGDLASGETATVTIVVVLPAGGVYTNTASAVSDVNDPNTADNTATLDVTAEDADLAVTKTADQDPVPAGYLLTYTVTVTNNGPGPAVNTVLTDTLPAGALYQSCATTHGTCAEAGGVVTAMLGDLANAEVATITIVVILPANGVYSNTATAVSDTHDPNLADNTATLDVTAEEADLVVVKTADQATAQVGIELTYTVTVTNNGPATAVNTVLTDTLPAAGITYVSCATTQGTCAEAGGIVTVTIGDILPGDTVTVTIVIMPDEGGDLVNTATAVSDVIDNNDGDNTSTVTTYALAFDLVFVDDNGRSWFCANGTTGEWAWTDLTNGTMLSFGGTGILTRRNGVLQVSALPGEPWQLTFRFYESYGMAYGSFVYRAYRVRSSLYDRDVTNNPPVCQ